MIYKVLLIMCGIIILLYAIANIIAFITIKGEAEFYIEKKIRIFLSIIIEVIIIYIYNNCNYF